MLIRVDPSSSIPVFQQIVDEIKSAIARGACRPGEMIPSVRHMAAQALVNPNTVAKAYRDLEREGVVTTRKGLGVFVGDKASRTCRDGRREDIQDKFKDIAAEARRAGMSDEELRAALDRALAEENARQRTEARGRK
jgi:GntR family transcriptional regulator